MDYSNYKTIQAERQGRVLNLTLNRPDVMNAINGEMHEELSRIFIDVSDDEDARVIVITGAGTHFSAGGDMEWLQSQIDNPELFEITARHGKRIIYSMLDCHKPVIARINGAAVGLGATIALMADIIIAEESAKIADPHVRIGFSAGDGGALIWPQLIGYSRAKEYLFTGDAIVAPEAARIGLINRSVPREELDTVTYNFAQRLASGARLAIENTKKTVNIGLKQLAHGLMEASLAYESETNRSAEHREGIAAFVEKRKPKF